MPRRTACSLVLLTLAAPLPGAARSSRPPPCRGGRYVLQGSPLLTADVLPGPDAIYFSATQVAVASGCRTGPVKLKGSKHGTKLKATFASCDGATGKVKLQAKIDPSCQTLTGKLRARKSKLKRKFTAVLTPSPVRACDFVPGVSVPATMPPEVTNPPPPTPPPPIELPTPTPVSPATTAAELPLFQGLWNAVNEQYVYPDFHGADWPAIHDEYQALIEQGLTEADFYTAMEDMIEELGDEHSYFQSPQQVADEEQRLQQGVDFVGIGILAQPIDIMAGTAAIIAVFPGSPAEEAGLKLHDLLLAVDGGPLRDQDGNSTTRGPAGTSFDLTYQRAGEAPQTISITRRAVMGALPIGFCMVPGTRIGYVLVPTLFDKTIDDQVRDALQDMTLDGPLDGLILDNRVNGGGLGSVAMSLLGLFTSGHQGDFVNRVGTPDPLDVVPEDVGGSQFVPLVVLADQLTVSYGEITTGILQHSGRATLVGGPTDGNVEQLHEYDLADGSRAWLATDTFAPTGLPPGVWEGVGITPDVLLRTRWDLFTEADDPGIAAALDLLGSAPAP
jgi:carboxyl-terminal processing protease